MKIIRFFLLLIFFMGCSFEKKLWLYVSFEYSPSEGGWFSGYIESSDGRFVNDVLITIDSVDSFIYVDTLRRFLNEYVYPKSYFDVSFKATGFKKVTCDVKIPEGINLIQFDGILSLSDNDGDTIIWESMGDSVDMYRVIIYKGYEKKFDKYLSSTSIVIYPDIFIYSGDYTINILCLNYSELNNAVSGSVVAGVYRLQRTYTIVNK